MPPQPDQNLLHGRWLHAHEEDQPGRMVFRPASYALPPSRGRTGYEFQPGGQLIRIGPGPTDRTESTTGSWSTDAQGRVAISMPGRPEQVLDIVDLSPERMVVRG